MENTIKSIWENATLPDFESLDGDCETDVLIIGGGITGILIAYELSCANVKCAIAEANTLCSGVTKNTTAKITSQHGYIYSRLLKESGAKNARMYYEANRSAVEKYKKLCADIDCDFSVQDSYVYALGTPDKMESELSALKALEIPHSFEDKPPLPFYALGAIRFENQAQFHPLKFLGHISKGLNVYEHTEVLKIENGVAYTSKGKIKAKKFVVATHFPFINKHGLYFLKMYQERAYVIGIKNSDIRGMHIDGEKGGLSLRSAGDYLLIGCGAHRTGKDTKGWDDAERFAAEYFKNQHIEFRFATQDCITPDGIPYIGQYSKNTPDLYAATGFNKWGMTTSMVAAELLRDLILGKENKYTSLFSPSRSILKPQVALNALEATVNLIRPTAPRCPHLGCALRWNKCERSWDCPCHGSRFDAYGNLINNPATKGLHNKKS